MLVSPAVRWNQGPFLLLMLAVFESSPSPTPSLHTLSVCTHWIPLPTPQSWQSVATGLYMKADCSSMEPGMIPQLTVCITFDGWEARALSHTHTHTHTHTHITVYLTDHDQLQTKTLRNDHAYEHSQTQPTPSYTHTTTLVIGYKYISEE